LWFRTMEYTSLGHTGLKVSRLCFGTMGMGSKEWMQWILTEEEGSLLIKKALDLGINFFDTADSYSNGQSEQILGNAIHTYARREEVVISTKVFFPMGNKGVNEGGLSRKHILSSIETSLKNLGTHYIDLYQIHRWDYETPIKETLDTLNDLVRSGKVRYIGASSMYAWQFAKALHTSEFHHLSSFISMQNQYSLLYREEEREMIPLCKDAGVGLIPFCPLARGRLARPLSTPASSRVTSDPITPKYFGYDFEGEIISRVYELSQKKNASMAQIALRWLLDKKGVVSPIVGATQATQLEDLARTFQVTPLTEEEHQYLEEPYRPRPLLNAL